MPRNNFLWCIVFLFVLFFLLACEGDVSSLDEDAYGSLDTAAIMLSVEWPDEAGTAEDCDVAGIVGEEDAYGARMSASPITLSDNCVGRGVDKVRVEVQNSSGATLKSATFDCSAGQGALRGVKPQSGCAVIVSGLNSAGIARYRGSKTNVTLHAGMNNVGRIQVEPLYTPQYTVSVTAGSGGSVTPSSRTVSHGSTSSFTVSPNTGYARDTSVGGTCSSGSWSGNTYTTGSVTGACSVSFSFSQTALTHTDITLSDLRDVGADNPHTPFDAGSSMFRFHLDANKVEMIYIKNFSHDDILIFENTPTGLAADFAVINYSFGDGDALVSVGLLDVQLFDLANDFFMNAETFMAIYGEGSLVFH